MPEQLDVATRELIERAEALGRETLALLDEQAALGSVAPGDARERAQAASSRRSVQSHSTGRVWWSGGRCHQDGSGAGRPGKSGPIQSVRGIWSATRSARRGRRTAPDSLSMPMLAGELALDSLSLRILPSLLGLSATETRS